eukprot:GILJ01003768.1.p1 GENE.GILJ01003768.1~~GILJ01003768.1.p1  ORF type:complete len:295 (+),score=34.32 GILJ01003768.1:122-1006(+)
MPISYCRVCFVHHELGRKHNFTNKHKTKLQQRLDKEKKRVTDVKFFLKNPALAVNNRAKVVFWCHFCEVDVDDSGNPRACGNALEHLSSEEHAVNVKSFLNEYSIDSSLVADYIVNQVEMYHYRQKLSAVAQQTVSESAFVGPLPLEKPMASIRSNGSDLKDVPGILSCEAAPLLQPACNSAIQMELHAPGLTSLAVPALADGQGNVHTGGRPPWLLDDEEFNQDDRHEARRGKDTSHRKRRKLSGRASASVSGRKSVSSEWLPDFGRVWNAGSRSDSRKEFLSEVSTKPPTRR